MGVMPCYRKNCENIMCDIYISDIGYICSGCQHEFGEKKYKTETKMLKALKEFMSTEKKNYYNDYEGVSLTDYLNRY